MQALVHCPDGTGTDSPSESIAGAAVGDSQCGRRQNVGAVLLRRIKYIGRFIYWAVRHCSTRHVVWVLAFEGYTWN